MGPAAKKKAAIRCGGPGRHPARSAEYLRFAGMQPPLLRGRGNQGSPLSSPSVGCAANPSSRRGSGVLKRADRVAQVARPAAVRAGQAAIVRALRLLGQPQRLVEEHPLAVGVLEGTVEGVDPHRPFQVGVQPDLDQVPLADPLQQAVPSGMPRAVVEQGQEHEPLQGIQPSGGEDRAAP